jgi:spermidine synthase
MQWLFSAAILVSSVLLMLVQPMVGRRVLPFLGGTPSVWATCMLFFQAGLLAGYGLAHLGPRWLGVRVHAILHVVALLAAFFLLPIRLEEPTSSPSQPALWLVGVLLLSAGLPFALLSASGPLFQKWYAGTVQRDPYFLYAASNLGSFAGLFAYPLLVEPLFSLSQQFDGWRWGFLILGIASALCAIALLRGKSAMPADTKPAGPAPSWREMALWVALAIVPSSLMLSVTTFLTTDVAPIPLLWVLPLGLYLLTFALVFRSGHSAGFHDMMTRWAPLAAVALAIGVLIQASEPLLLVLVLHLGGFFVIAMYCHGELALRRPGVAHLTTFYFCLALGGVLGGSLNGLIGPMLFRGPYEYPLMLVAVGLLLPRERGDGFIWADAIIPAALFAVLLALVPIVYPIAESIRESAIHPATVCGPALIAVFLFADRPWRFALGMAAVFLAMQFHPEPQGEVLHRTRSFFGSLRVTEKDGFRQLLHGSTLHGMQATRGDLRYDPLTYYHRNGPVGQVMKGLENDSRRDRIGVVGLGTGSLAAYAEKGQHYTFFEIDSTVVALSRERKYFTYLDDAKGMVDIELGDARLSLARSKETFGMLLIDAFGSDAIPIHLLTSEAMDIYDRRLASDGLLLVHVSNRFLNLEPVVAKHAADRGWVCRIASSDVVPEKEHDEGRRASVWIVVARKEDDIPASIRGAWPRAKTKEGMSAWTDDYANILPTLSLR